MTFIYSKSDLNYQEVGKLLNTLCVQFSFYIMMFFHWLEFFFLIFIFLHYWTHIGEEHKYDRHKMKTRTVGQTIVS